MNPENTTEFDLQEHNAATKQMREIRSNNMKRVFGQGAGRIAIFAVSGVFLLLIVAGLWNMMHHGGEPQAAMPTSAMPSTGGVQGDAMAASDKEAQLRRQANANGASDAAVTHTPYMASPVLVASGTQATSGDDWGGFSAGAPVHASQLAAAASDTSVNAGQTNFAAGNQTVSVPHAPVSVTSIADELKGDKGPVGSQINLILGSGSETSGGGQPPQPGRRTFSTGTYPQPAQIDTAATGATQQASNFLQTSAPSSASNPQASAIKVIIPGWTMGQGFYCKVRFGANSDLVRKDVFADCYNGVANGAIFHGTATASAEGVGDPGFTVEFTTVQIPGKGTFPCEAVAFSNNTMEASVADDVNEHNVQKFTELAVAGLLQGIGKAAQVVTGTSNTQTVGNVSTTALSVQAPTPAQIAENAAGGVGNAIGDYIQKKSDALKTTIKIFPGKDIGVVLVNDVEYQKH
jgi:hypothetical protein